jgi:Tfp pilus assembly protein PilN
MDKKLAIAKAYNIKLQTKNKHLLAKTTKVDKATRNVQTLKQKYNELNQVHFKSRNDFKVLQNHYDWFKLINNWFVSISSY